MPFSFAFYRELTYSNDRSDIYMGEIVDIIVIGGGFAGLSEAIEASLTGKKVVVFAKMAKMARKAAIAATSGGLMGVMECLNEVNHKHILAKY